MPRLSRPSKTKQHNAFASPVEDDCALFRTNTRQQVSILRTFWDEIRRWEMSIDPHKPRVALFRPMSRRWTGLVPGWQYEPQRAFSSLSLPSPCRSLRRDACSRGAIGERAPCRLPIGDLLDLEPFPVGSQSLA